MHLSPGASDPRRRWPVEHFACAAAALVSSGAKVVVVGADEDRPLAQALQASVPEVVALAGEISLKHFAGLAGRAALLAGNDSGPLNVARAVGTATGGIYWIGNVINAGALTRRRHRVIASCRGVVRSAMPT